LETVTLVQQLFYNSSINIKITNTVATKSKACHWTWSWTSSNPHTILPPDPLTQNIGKTDYMTILAYHTMLSKLFQVWDGIWA